MAPTTINITGQAIAGVVINDKQQSITVTFVDIGDDGRSYNEREIVLWVTFPPLTDADGKPLPPPAHWRLLDAPTTSALRTVLQKAEDEIAK